MTRPDRSVPPDGSALDIAEAAFSTLTTSPDGLVVNGADIHAGLPSRPVGLRELRVLLAHPATSAAAWHAAWAYLVGRRDEPAWQVGAVGVAMPLLRRTAGGLAAGYCGDPADLDAEVLIGFLGGLRRVSPAAPRLGVRLAWAAYRAGVTEARRHSVALPGGGSGVSVAAAMPPEPWGAPRGVLAQAVAAEVLSAADAALIAVSRLDGMPLAVLSTVSGPGEELAVRLGRAEDRLAQAIVTGRVGVRVPC
ncbi:hypothetical protein [Candidatus Protofrankia californiensis]|uniref:hypothetical protein n=1 Tax=Candidatus Protofrankia californiensis TaxID=1839754 RepID=UPI00104129E5|nr:hypothetical protein [Candidatus Protofrankia californiensis]